MIERYYEEVAPGYGQRFTVDNVLCDIQTEYQHLMIFDHCHFGRVMVLDGILQSTRQDEFIYHEMMAHVPLFAHGHAKRVLIIGGGDGGTLREVLRHKTPIQVALVEIDGLLLDACREYLPQHHQGAFEDPRTRLLVQDGIRFVKESTESFDVIIIDSTDPVGPGKVLFTEDFYAACRRCLAPGGILVTQNGVAFFQLEEVTSTAQSLSHVFEDFGFYSAAVPTYIGGIMAFGWASDDPGLRAISLDILKTRYAAAGISTGYYTPHIHRAAFVLPRYVQAAIDRFSDS
jgi:spermidine synthase